jgi:hypothetical protein
VSTVDERATIIYAFLREHQGEKFTLGELCTELDLEPGQKTQTAMRQARDLATAAGLHFPPAVPANGFTYTVTDLPEDAFDPAMHMERIVSGVQRRADVGWDYLKRHQGELGDDVRPVVLALLEMQESLQGYSAAIRKAFDDLIVATIRSRRGPAST